MMKRILIGSCGGLTGIYLARCFSKMEKFIIYGADSAEVSAGTFFTDKSFTVPSAGAEDFLNVLVDLIQRESIEYYFPTHSKEIKRVAESEAILRQKTDVKFMVSPVETFHHLESKKQAYYSLSEAGIPTPVLIEGDPEEFPVIMKGNYGSGGSSVLKIDNMKVYRAYRETAGEVAFYEYVRGREYTTDCMFDQNGRLLAWNVRERIKTIGGAVVITRNTMDFDILPWLKKLEQAWVFRGCVNFQFIVQNGIPYFTDINLRYPSGGLPLTVYSGVNIPEMMLRLLDGERIELEEYTAEQKQITMYRYFDEVFEDDSP